jgi:hypothetical protein
MIKKLIAGDSLSLLDSVENCPASDGWLLKTRLVPVVAGSAINLTSTAQDDQFLTSASSTTTAAWVAGIYSYSVWVEKGTERITVEQGRIEILPNAASATVATDTRSHIEKTLAAIEAVLEGRASQDVQEYTIGDRQLKHIPLNELLVWRDKYKAQLIAEDRSKSASKTFGRKIHMRF